MKVSKNWLENWIDLSAINNKKLLSLFETLGYEIENYITLSPNYKNIVVGTVTNIEKIPKAEKIRLVTVDVGNTECNIICGAWNFNIQDKVAVATPGSYIKDNFKIENRAIMGINSNGMICSPTELDLWDDENTILVLTENFSNGTLLENCYQSSDLIIELSITPNRGDSMSHYGLARELATATGIKLNSPKKTYSNDIGPKIKISHGKNSGCRSYYAIEIENIEVRNSNLDTMFKLSSVGLRPINNFVDATNYVLFDLGQPLHAFDRDKLSGPISVRKAKKGEKLKTLDEVDRKLNNQDIVITDSNNPVALGGVMGGLHTQITETTSNVLIESANFNSVNILNTSRSLNLISEASMRFERGVDNELQEMALVAFRECITSTKNNYSFTNITGSRDKNTKTNKIIFSIDYFEKIIGVPVTVEKVLEIFNGLGFVSNLKKDKTIEVVPPSWRYDIDREIDLVEEIARHLNYDSFPSTISYGNNFSVGNEWTFINEISNILVAEGYFECSNLSFISKEESIVFTPEREPVSLSNPLDESQKYLRTTSVTHLLNNLSSNANIGNDLHSLFEIGVSFTNTPNNIDKSIPEQINFVTLASSENVPHSDRRRGVDNYDIYNMKKTIQLIAGNNLLFEPINRPGMHSMQSFTIMSEEVNLGWFGKVSDQTNNFFNLKKGTYVAEINLDKLQTIKLPLVKYQNISNFPFIKFDLSFELSKNVKAKDMLDLVYTFFSLFENSSYIFDEYFDPKNNKRTIGIRIKLRNHKQTITDDELVRIRTDIIKEISENFPAILKDYE